MGLFKPSWQSDKKEKALKAVEDEANQKTLGEIAKNAPLEEVRIAAVRKLTDQAVLADVAKNPYANSLVVNYRAIETISDDAILKDIEYHYNFLCIKQPSNNSMALRDCAKSRRAALLKSNKPHSKDVVSEYMKDPKHQHICNLITELDSTSYDTRKKAAVALIQVANTEPQVIVPIWDWLRAKVEEPYQSVRVNEFDREEAGEYSDRGVGMRFPQKPKAT